MLYQCPIKRAVQFPMPSKQLVPNLLFVSLEYKTKSKLNHLSVSLNHLGCLKAIGAF